jgi:dTDP-glucose 4,6-dehydratase
MRLLVTGGAGFIASNYIHHILSEHSDWHVTNLDKLTYAGNLENLTDIEKKDNYRFVQADISDSGAVSNLVQQGFDAIINFAAESHVDRSILEAAPFITSNILGTQVLLESAREFKVTKFIQISTDEVYGSVARGYSNETRALCPSSPYSASKASADLLALAYHKTFGLPVMITRCTNNFGPYQFPEKLLPLVITNALENKPIPVYGDGKNKRDWIYVTDHCRAITAVLLGGTPGEIYNIGAGNEKTNIAIVSRILNILGKPKSLIQFVGDRLGHDRRYAVNTSKIGTELNWSTGIDFGSALELTVKWYVENENWWRRVKSGEYLQYYEKVYRKR